MRKTLIPALFIVIPLIVLAAARGNPTLADAFVEHVFPVLTVPYARLTGLFPFSLGEWMLVAAAILLVLLVIISLALLFSRKLRTHRAGIKRFYRAYLILAAIFTPVMICNCFLCYAATPLPAAADSDLEALISLRNLVTERCDTLSHEVMRDEDGYPVYDADADATMQDACRGAVNDLGASFPRLAGYQAYPKALFFSGFVSRQHMEGYYFPFSMEANYNSIMQDINKPFAICHELAHTHGYLREDEANLLGFLACVRASDPFIQYSGWLAVLNYVDNDVYRALGKGAYAKLPAVSKRVREDNLFLTDEAWEKVNARAIIPEETVQKAAETYVDTTLKVNGISNGKVSYSRVVSLILAHTELLP